MDASQIRVIGSLMLLLATSFFIIGLYSGQLNIVWNIVKKIFEAAVAGAP